jgi:hypothetical protein
MIVAIHKPDTSTLVTRGHFYFGWTRLIEELTFRLRVELQSSPITPIREVTVQPLGLMTLPAATFPAITEQSLK